MNNTGGITIFDFGLYYRVIAIKRQHDSGTKTDMETLGTE
jgi:hypothetical protein